MRTMALGGDLTSAGREISVVSLSGPSIARITKELGLFLINAHHDLEDFG